LVTARLLRLPTNPYGLKRPRKKSLMAVILMSEARLPDGQAKNLLSLKRKNKADSSGKQRPRNDKSCVFRGL
jgi:hypothetical protein